MSADRQNELLATARRLWNIVDSGGTPDWTDNQLYDVRDSLGSLIAEVEFMMDFQRLLKKDYDIRLESARKALEAVLPWMVELRDVGYRDVNQVRARALVKVLETAIATLNSEPAP